MRKVILLSLATIGLCYSLCGCQCAHEFTDEITSKPTCYSVGVRTFTCTQCDESYTEEIAMVAHNWEEPQITKEPTCTDQGEKTVTCTVCNSHEVVELIPVVEHVYNDIVSKEATCTDEGEITPTCDCGAIGTPYSTDKIGHKYVETITKEATYKKTGTKQFKCSGCGDTYTKDIKRLSVQPILDKSHSASDHVGEAIDYMSSAITYYRYGKHNSGQTATAYMLIETGLAIKEYKSALNLCGKHDDLSEITAMLTTIINELEYVTQFSDITTSNYYTEIVKDIWQQDIYQNAVEYEKQLISLFLEFAPQ